MKAAAILILLALAGCDLGDDEQQEARETAGLDLSNTRATTQGKRAGRTYLTYDTLRDAQADQHGAPTFKGITCLETCADQQSGYAAAAKAGVGDERKCDGPTWGYIEGCTAFALSSHPR